MRDMRHELSGLLAKKRTGRLQKRRIATLSEQLESATQPPLTPPRVNTGERGDYQGNVYAAHASSAPTLRKMRRVQRFGRHGIQPMRSRIQRNARRRRTGGVK